MRNINGYPNINITDQQRQMSIQKNAELIKQIDAKEDQKKARAMGMKNPDFSLGWTIADTRCYMIILQLFVAGLCGFLLLASYTQMTAEADNECDDADVIVKDGSNKYHRPYFGDKDGVTFGCPWSFKNSVMRMISPAVGLICALTTILLSYWKGEKILRDMKRNNDKRGKVNKLEYFDLYNQYFVFKFMRFVLGLCAYLQFISVGFDLYSYLVGAEYILSEYDVKNNDIPFQIVIVISFVVGILLRVSHDAMYQRVYKHKLRFNIGLAADKGYAGATVVDKDKIDVVAMGDTHHLGPTQNDLAAQQRQYLENQNRMLSTSSVYG